MTFFYAVKVGRQTGIFEKREQFITQTKGFSGAVGKKFKNRKDACQYLGLCGPFLRIEKSIPSATLNEFIKNKSCILIYVDGSFSVEEERISYSFAVIGKKQRILYEYGGTKPCSDKSNGIFLAEAAATMRAVKHSILKRKTHLILFHDNLQIRDVLNWNKDKTSIEQQYCEFMKNMSKKYNLMITFVKVKSHEKDKLNKYVDNLAKKTRKIPIPF